MKDSEVNVIVGLIAIAAVIYFAWPKKLAGDDGTGDGSHVFVPGGGDATTGYGVTGSWLTQMRQPLL